MYMEVVSSEENIPGVVDQEAVYDEIDEFRVNTTTNPDDDDDDDDQYAKPIFRISSKVV